MRELFDLDLHLVTDRQLTLDRDILDIISAAIKGGISLVQLREKDCSTRDFVELGHAVCRLLKPQNIPFIINDRVDVALAVGADGVHIGQSDMPYAMARQLLGSDAIIGLSVESVGDALVAEKLDLDYLGLSPVFMTPTKNELNYQLGLEGVQEIRKISSHPLIGIGGIHDTNTLSILNAGADGIAVVSAICSAIDPEKAAHGLRQQINQTK